MNQSIGDSIKTVLVTIVIGLIIVFLTGLVIDYLRKDKYTAKKNRYRSLENSIGGGEEYYYNYWAWQPNKKKFYERILLERHHITRPYTGHARKRKQNVKNKIPFRREIYGKAL